MSARPSSVAVTTGSRPGEISSSPASSPMSVAATLYTEPTIDLTWWHALNLRGQDVRLDDVRAWLRRSGKR